MPKCFAVIVLALALYFLPAQATLGVDVSSTIMPATWQCLKSNGYTFGVVRCYESGGRPDPNGVHTVANAWAGGMAHVDVYMFPCPKCGNPASQVTQAVNYLKQYNTTYGMFWFDIEGPQYWSADQGTNRNFFTGLVAQARSMGQTIGVYSSASQWDPIMGSWTGGSAYPLWYAHYDNVPGFGDFKAFGGWSKPNIKQFAGDATVCGADIDKDFY